jgi:hypothetical protein
MDRYIADTLEAIANLLYLARVSLDNKETADAYLAMAEDIIRTTAQREAGTRPSPGK